MDKKSLAPASISTHAEAGIEIVAVERSCFSKFYITAFPHADLGPDGMFEALAAFLKQRRAVMIQQDVLGSSAFHQTGMRALAASFPKLEWPVTWIDGASCSGGSIAATQAYAVSGAPVRPIRVNGRLLGGSFDDGDAKYCFLGDVRSRAASGSRRAQARETFELIETALAQAGMAFTDVVRTWFYIHDILDWYDDFNRVRTKFFRERGVFDNLVPASTGVGTDNPYGAAVIADAFAIRRRNGNVTVAGLPSPLQCPAPAYGSSFSRAVHVRLPDHQRLYVSGTASISPDGATAHVGDVDAQIDLTVRVIDAIMRESGFKWSDVSRSVAYLKRPEDWRRFLSYCKRNRMPHFPVAIARSDICRDDLLFELEVDAVSI